jgi:hypothetical protein
MCMGWEFLNDKIRDENTATENIQLYIFDFAKFRAGSGPPSLCWSSVVIVKTLMKRKNDSTLNHNGPYNFKVTLLSTSNSYLNYISDTGERKTENGKRRTES